MLTREEKIELARLIELKGRRDRENMLSQYTPWPKQLEFHAAGSEHRERLFMAGNQLGKSYCAGSETAMHLTGLYPERGQVFYPTEKQLRHTIATGSEREKLHAEGLLLNLGELGLYGADIYPNGWPGKRFNKPVWFWAASVSGIATRDNPQRILIGPPADREQWGTGAIPRSCLVNKAGLIQPSMASGTPNLIDTILVRHVSGRMSMLQFKTYEQGRERWQGPTIDGLWFDEEPPEDIYDEGLTRTNITAGPAYLSFTPLLGMSKVVQKFISVDDAEFEGA